MAGLFPRVVAVSVTCTLVSACAYFERYGMAVTLFSRYTLCPADRIAVQPLPPPEPPADFAADPQRLSMWQKENAGWSLYRLEGCGATTVYRCHWLGKCGGNMR